MREGLHANTSTNPGDLAGVWNPTLWHVTKLMMPVVEQRYTKGTFQTVSPWKLVLVTTKIQRRPAKKNHKMDLIWKGLEVFHSGWNIIHRRVYGMEKPQHVHDRLVQNKKHDGKVQQRPSDCHQKFERVKEENSNRNWTKGNGWGAGMRKAQLKAADGARGGEIPAFLKHQKTFWGSALAPHNRGWVCKHLAVVLAHWGFTQPSTPASSVLIRNNYFFYRNTQHTKTFRREDWDEQTNASFVILQLGVWRHHHIWRMWECVYEREQAAHTLQIKYTKDYLADYRLTYEERSDR